MKKYMLAIVTMMFALHSYAQVKDPVSWKFEATKKTGNHYEVLITATVQKPWHIYSHNTGKGGPVPTTIAFKKNPLVSLQGAVKESGKLEKVFDKNFNTNVLYYADQVQFTQIVMVKGNIKTNISGTVEYMVCDDSQCLPPTSKTFDIKLQ